VENVIPFPDRERCNACLMAPTIASHDRAVADLQQWQTRQNGSLSRLEEKVDRLQFWIMTTLATSLLGVIGLAVSLLVRKTA
jgi:hypothetical protein